MFIWAVIAQLYASGLSLRRCVLIRCSEGWADPTLCGERYICIKQTTSTPHEGLRGGFASGAGHVESWWPSGHVLGEGLLG